ncbi:hypothetical protein GCM10010372_26660 [Streptomyces tauricus]|uniref:Secreted protein n=1 Tax=Streptomyces tauricus TaxID=68274 RepID=A0ABZ1JJY2_9ACTN|nr:hypothetical protein [Streptomyces tauricus]MCW8094962.1 hypothetical protein [Streptomyces tauricus]GHA25369.1 hypothetical protein GCM10010372_26660 [Streptomyces tauricus]
MRPIRLMLQPACPAASVPSVSPERRTHHARTAATVALIASAVLIGVLAPQAAAARAAARAPQSAPVISTASSALPLPLPATAVEPLVTEGIGIEGPLINNLTLPTLR